MKPRLMCVVITTLCFSRAHAAFRELPCNCINTTLDCSSRMRVSFSITRDNVCKGNVTKVDLSHNPIMRINGTLGPSVNELILRHTDFIIPPLESQLVVLDMTAAQLGSWQNFRAFSALQYLDISRNQLRAISLPSQCSLRFLNASLNMIIGIDNLADCFKIEIMDLSKNPISWVNNSTLENFNNLKFLSLGGTSLRILPPGLLYNLRTLRVLNLSKVWISSHATEFQMLKNLRTLRLIDARFDSIPSLSLPSLEHLDISECDLLEAPWNTLVMLRPLKSLRLARYVFTGLPVQAFAQQMNLTSLDLSGNNITVLSSGVFKNLHQLVSLSLSDCSLQTFSATDLANLTGLTELDLSNNEITRIESKSFNYLNGIKNINLKNNKIASLPDDLFSNTPTLEKLELDSNELCVLPNRVFFQLSSLTTLHLSHNPLQILEYELTGLSVFSGLSNLEDLRVQSTHLETLHPNTFNGLTKLKILDIANNKLTSLPDEIFTGLTSLRKIFLTKNSLINLPENLLKGLVNLEELIFPLNRIQFLSNKMLRQAPSLKLLNAWGNNIEEIAEDLFAGLPNLTHIYLNSNNVYNFPPNAVANLPHLQTLSLKNNYLTQWGWEYDGIRWPAMGQVLLDNNPIAHMSEWVMRSWLLPTREERMLMMNGSKLRSAADLEWLLEDDALTVKVVWNCACGHVRYRFSHVFFCVDMKCGNVRWRPDGQYVSADWIDAVKRGRIDPHQE